MHNKNFRKYYQQLGSNAIVWAHEVCKEQSRTPIALFAEGEEWA
jgi:hypothetical protein